ncbi:MAG: hypothetical protein VX550_05735 [Bacteroidota bacterium]|nr:hypothetical protein [Bacteroidota bacterium]
MSNKLPYGKVLISAFIGGSVYAFIMSAFYIYMEERPFSFIKFIIDLILGMAIMFAVTYYNYRKRK